jgi:hypothetical protein
MAFSEEVVKRAWARSNGQCECRREHDFHKTATDGGSIAVICQRNLKREERGRFGGWEAHEMTKEELKGTDPKSDCLIVCWMCHLKIKSALR